ncbi:MAG: formate/nitrite transporter family protein [Acidobacteria bacterium]|nr:formate/nitrite transporter family protein [Acidobacteriota bacterium]
MVQKPFQTDAYLPREMAQRVNEVGVTKAKMEFWSMLYLAILAGSFIGLGAHFATLASANNGMPFSLSQLLAGLVFSLGLILVIVAGAELFTGNNLIVMAYVSRKIGLRDVVRNWGIVLLGNTVGALITVGLIYLSGVWVLGSEAVGTRAIQIAAAKTDISWLECFFRGVMCNALVCLAVWLCFSCRATVDKIIAIIFPITAFVSMGFEHSIANLYFIPMGMLLSKLQPELAARLANPAQSLDISGFLGNLIPVTLGNIVGGTLMVGLVYWFIYLRGLSRIPNGDS